MTPMHFLSTLVVASIFGFGGQATAAPVAAAPRPALVVHETPAQNVLHFKAKKSKHSTHAAGAAAAGAPSASGSPAGDADDGSSIGAPPGGEMTPAGPNAKPTKKKAGSKKVGKKKKGGKKTSTSKKGSKTSKKGAHKKKKATPPKKGKSPKVAKGHGKKKKLPGAGSNPGPQTGPTGQVPAVPTQP